MLNISKIDEISMIKQRRKKIFFSLWFKRFKKKNLS